MNSGSNNASGQVPNTTGQNTATNIETPVTPATQVVPSQVSGNQSAEAPAVDAMPQQTQQRVQLVNDKVALKAVSQTNMDQQIKSNEGNAVVNTDSTSTSVENNKGNKFQNILLILLFVGLLLFIFNIDKVSVYLKSRQENRGQVVEKITTGTLVCESEKNSSAMDFTYTAKFEFRDSRLKRLNYATEIRGDINLDEEKLNELYNECLAVKKSASSLSGIDITCSLENGLLKERQIFTYDSVNRAEAMSAFIEAGGIYPDYKQNQNIDDIEIEMNAAAYNCKRIK